MFLIDFTSVDSVGVEIFYETSIDCRINNVPLNYAVPSNYENVWIEQTDGRTDGNNRDIRYLILGVET